MKSWRAARSALAIMVVIASAVSWPVGGQAADPAGTITEYLIPPDPLGAPWGITAGPDGNLWIAEASGGNVLKLTTTGSFTQYHLPGGAGGFSDPRGIAVGADGNLWVTEQAGTRIAKVTITGSITEYPTPSPQPGVMFGIAAGPDGHLWFTEAGVNKVAKLTTSGEFTEYSIPTASSFPAGIAAGPDGNLWITESNANKIAKVTPTGAFVEYPIPTLGSAPVGIAAGPDGNLWFTETSGNKVAVITTAGTFTEYLVPTPGSLPWDITAGPDGNLWFTEQSASKVGVVTTSGTFAEYSTPTAFSGPRGITAGPDGNVWITEDRAQPKPTQGPGQVAKVGTGGVVNATLSYTGDTAQDYEDLATLSAVLINAVTGAPVSGESVSFILGAQSCGPVATDNAGKASCTLTLNQTPGPYTVSASFSGDTKFSSSSTSSPFTITKEEAKLSSSTSLQVFVAGGTATLSSVLTDPDSGLAITSKQVTMTVGLGPASQTCAGTTDATGTATCTIGPVSVPLGSQPIGDNFAGDAFYKPASNSQQAMIFAFPAVGSFVIGDKSSSGVVNWWGAQWTKMNALSSGQAPHSFKGFADTIAGSPKCGQSWSSTPGSSSNPPTSVPSFMGVIVSHSIGKSASTILGDTIHIVIVQTAPGYSNDPGGAGSGAVVATYC